MKNKQFSVKQMDSKDVDYSKKYMVMTCGSEDIIIETNDFSEGSESSESECSSNSEFEEIEVGPSLKTTGQHDNNDFKNPFVRLVRCDNLLSNKRSYVLPRSRNLQYRSSNRKKRPNRSYSSEDFYLYDLAYKNVIAKPFSTKKCSSSSKHMYKSLMSKTEMKNRGKYTSNYETNKYEFEIDNPLITFNEASLVPTTNNEIDGMQQNIFIKSEPFDEYFDEFNQKTDWDLATSLCIKQEGSDYCQEEANETNNRQIFSHGQYVDTFRQNNTFHSAKMKVGKNQSDESDVDIENDWDCSEFITCQKIVEFDHNYHIPTETTTEETYQSNSIQTVWVKKEKEKKRKYKHCKYSPGVSSSKVRPRGTAKEEYLVVYIISRSIGDTEYFLVVQRPFKEGHVLVSQWVFPFQEFTGGKLSRDTSVDTVLRKNGVKTFGLQILMSDTIHKFTTNERVVLIQEAHLGNITASLEDVKCRYVTREDLKRYLDAALMKKAFFLYDRKKQKPEIFTRHNFNERARREQMALAFQELRDKIPNLEGKHLASKVSIMENAVRYIKELEAAEESNKVTLRRLQAANIDIMKKHIGEHYDESTINSNYLVLNLPNFDTDNGLVQLPILGQFIA